VSTLAAVSRVPMQYGLPLCLPEDDLYDTEGMFGAVLTHLSPDQGVLDLDLRDPRMLPPAELPEVTTWTRRYLVTLLDVLSGLRPTQQLLRWSSADIYAGIQRRAVLQARARTRRGAAVRAARVTSVRVSFPYEDIAEVTGVLRDTDRVRAVAMRVERCTDRSGERWRVTALELG